MTKNLFEQSLKHTGYNINPHVKDVNLSLQQYEYYLQQEMIANSLIRFLNNIGFTVKKENDGLSIEKNNNIIIYESGKKEDNNVI